MFRARNPRFLGELNGAYSRPGTGRPPALSSLVAAVEGAFGAVDGGHCFQRRTS